MVLELALPASGAPSVPPSPAFTIAREGTAERPLLRVRPGPAGTTDGVDPLSRLAELLDGLRADGADAAPAVVERTRECLLLETGAPMRSGTGRHRSVLVASSVDEQRGRARARAALEDLVAGAHRRGWVIGLDGDVGLGRRPDGTAVLVDPSALRQDTGTRARRMDLEWIEAVAGDEDRTVLRRRVDAQPEPETHTTGARPSLPALVAAHRAGGRSRGRTARSRTGARGSRRRSRIRERYLVGASLALTLVILVGGGLWHVHGGAGAVDAGPAPSGSPRQVSQEAPMDASLSEPVPLVQDVVTRRHRHLTEQAAAPAAVAGSPAAAQDEAVRAAYEGIEVAGPAPLVQEAEVVSGPDDDRATIRALVAAQDQTVTGSDGETRRLPPESPAEVELHLRYVDGTWLIEDVLPT